MTETITEPTAQTETFAPGDRVRIAENWISERESGGLGDSIVGYVGTIGEAIGNGRYAFMFERDGEGRTDVWAPGIPIRLHGRSFERITHPLTEADTLALGDRVRTVANWLRPGDVGGLGDRIVGLTGQITGTRPGRIYEFRADPGQNTHPDGEPRVRYGSNLSDVALGLHISSFERIEQPVPDSGTPAVGDRVKIVRSLHPGGSQANAELIGLYAEVLEVSTAEPPSVRVRTEEAAPPDRGGVWHYPGAMVRLAPESFEKVEPEPETLEAIAVGDTVRMVEHIMTDGVRITSSEFVGATGTVTEVHDGHTLGPDYPFIRVRLDGDRGEATLHPRSFRKVVPDSGTPDPNEANEVPNNGVALEVGDLDAVASAWSSDGIAALIGSIRHTQGEILAAEAEHAERKERFQTVASKVANDEEWCPVFTKIMDDFGMTRIDTVEEHDADWWTRVTISIDHSVSDDEAANIVSDYYDIDGDVEVQIPGYTTIKAEVEIEVRGTRTREDNDCFCDDIDSDDIDGLLPEWYDSSSMSYEEGTMYCDHD